MNHRSGLSFMRRVGGGMVANQFRPMDVPVARAHIPAHHLASSQDLSDGAVLDRNLFASVLPVADRARNDVEALSQFG
jgi:hypothetical protein